MSREQLTADEHWCADCKTRRRFRRFSPKDSYMFCVECKTAFDPFRDEEPQDAVARAALEAK